MSARDKAAQVLTLHFVGSNPRTHATVCSCGWEGVSRLGDHMGRRRDATAHVAEVLAEAGLLIDSGMDNVDSLLFRDWRDVAETHVITSGHHKARAEAAEARLARVGALADEWERESPAWRDPVAGPVAEIRAALTGEAPR